MNRTLARSELLDQLVFFEFLALKQPLEELDLGLKHAHLG